MQGSGFEEAQASYGSDDPRRLIGTYHRIAGIGPSYAVIDILDDGYASIEMLETGEHVRYRIADVRLDPHPDTICSHSPLT